VIYASLAAFCSLCSVACSDDGLPKEANTGIIDDADSYRSDVGADVGFEADVESDADSKSVSDAEPKPDADLTSDADTDAAPDAELSQIKILTSPSSAAAGDTLSASFQLADDLGRPVEFAGVAITITLNKHQFVDGDNTRLTTTDDAGIARFEFLIGVVDTGYALTVTSDHAALLGIPISSNFFSIITGEASAETSTISGTDGSIHQPAGIPITIELFDAYGNPVAESTPKFSATGAGNTYSACSQTDADGRSTCTMRSNEIGPKTLKVDEPVEVVGDTIEFFGWDCDESGAPFGAGSGESDDPYRICTPAHLNAIGQHADYMARDFVVTREIDMQGVQDFNIIGSEDNPFVGLFDGDHKSIKNLVIHRETEDYIALFSYVGQSSPFRPGYLMNIVLEDVDIKGGGGATGGIVSHCVGAIQNSHVTGSVEGDGEFTGGFAGDGVCAITDSHFIGSVKGRIRVGGLAGFSGGRIVNSYSAGSVEGTDYVGGLTAYNYGPIQNSYSTASVEGENHVGGLIGLNTSKEVTSVYSSGSVTGRGTVRDIGGLIGTEVHQSFTLGSYWDTITSTMSLSDAGTPLSTADFADPSKFVGWDFVDTWVIGAAPDGETRPILQWQQN